MDFFKSKLQNWDIIVLRNKKRYIVNVERRTFIGAEGNLYMYGFCNRLRSDFKREYDVVEVYRPNYTDYYPGIEGSLKEKDLIWKRKWYPERGGYYYVPVIDSDYGHCNVRTWRNDDRDKFYLRKGLVLKTRKEAIEVAKKNA